MRRPTVHRRMAFLRVTDLVDFFEGELLKKKVPIKETFVYPDGFVGFMTRGGFTIKIFFERRENGVVVTKIVTEKGGVIR